MDEQERQRIARLAVQESQGPEGSQETLEDWRQRYGFETNLRFNIMKTTWDEYRIQDNIWEPRSNCALGTQRKRDKDAE